jgi:ribonuclease HI
MELMAVLEALRENVEGPVEIVSDSTYVVKCFNDKWHVGWLRRGWKNSQGQPVANRDLWEPLFELVLNSSRNVTFSWVKGHSGDVMNDFVDALATVAADSQRPRHS